MFCLLLAGALLEYCRDTKSGDPKCQAHGPTCQGKINLLEILHESLYCG